MVAARVIRPVGILISSFGEMEGARASVKRLLRSGMPHLNEKHRYVSKCPGKGRVQGFSSNPRRQGDLKKCKFSVPANSIVAVVGPAASGKTTLLKVIQGFIKPTVGSVLIDGRSC